MVKFYIVLATGLNREPVIVDQNGKGRLAISFFEGSSDLSVSETIKQAIFMMRTTNCLVSSTMNFDNPLESYSSSSDVNFILEDPTDGSFVATSNAIPDGVVLNCLVLKKSPSSSSSSSSSSPSRADCLEAGRDSSGRFENGEISPIVKFERLNSHLANERTWLAWIRCVFDRGPKQIK